MTTRSAVRSAWQGSDHRVWQCIASSAVGGCCPACAELAAEGRSAGCCGAGHGAAWCCPHGAAGCDDVRTTVWFTWWRSGSRPCTPRMKCSLVLPAPCPWYQGSVVVELGNCELDELAIPLLGALVLTECSGHKAPACLLTSASVGFTVVVI
jgi:hypothetical protein